LVHHASAVAGASRSRRTLTARFVRDRPVGRRRAQTPHRPTVSRIDSAWR
jgi:hypothetical protein